MVDKLQQVWDYCTNFENKAKNKLAIALCRMMRQKPGGVNLVKYKQQCAKLVERGKQLVAWRMKQSDLSAATATDLLEVILPE
jgi:hypothetical protein